MSSKICYLLAKRLRRLRLQRKLTQEEAAKIWALRNAINPMEDIEMTELLIDKMKKTKNNEAFLRSMNSGAM